MEYVERTGLCTYSLSLTNQEVKIMFESMIRDWFSGYCEEYDDFLKALLADDLDLADRYVLTSNRESGSASMDLPSRAGRR